MQLFKIQLCLNFDLEFVNFTMSKNNNNNNDKFFDKNNFLLLYNFTKGNLFLTFLIKKVKKKSKLEKIKVKNNFPKIDKKNCIFGIIF